MAATVQIGNTATTTKTTGSNNNPPIGGGGVGGGGNPAPNLTQNPRLKRIVYSKYRELLGSYNDKANAIIETLPAYMVHEDRGFQGFEPRLVNDQIYGTSPASTMSGGNPSQRLPAQQPYEAPACVQNAMMTKDKKPFTYTPGGIDLSQIKSERMAKRLARNAQAEGATGASQINRPTQQPGSPCGSPAAASIGAAAMGMPFQVFPAGPTPPPPSPATGKQHTPGSVGSAAAPLPPPPPPPSSNTLAPSTNRGGSLAPGSPNAARKSPTPQRFEPPPLGFRPEIKIPPNPMAALKKITPPVEKNSFWVDEYRKERSKSPMVNANESNTENIPNGGTEAGTNNDDETMAQEPTINNINHNNNSINNNYQQYSPPTQQSYSPKLQQEKPQHSPPLPEFRSVAPPQSPAVHVYTVQQPQQQLNEAARGPNSAMQPQRTTESPFKYAQQQQQQQRPVQPSSPLAQQQQQPSAPSPTNSTSSSNGSKSGQTVPWRTQRGPEVPQAQVQQQQQHPQPIYNNVKSRDVYSPAPEGSKPTNVGSLYIAPLDQPVEPQAQNIVRQQQILQQQQQQIQEQQQQRQPPTARWMSTQPLQKEQPAWARPEENGNVVPSSLQRIKSPPPAAVNTQQHRPQGNGYANSQDFGGHAPSHSTGLRLQINTGTNNQSGAPKERIIPIQLEQTPTPTQVPAQSNFGSQPHYNNNSINNGTGSVAPSSYVMRSPNQFVDQGYNNYSEVSPPHQQEQQQQQKQLHLHVASPQQQYTNSDINNVGGPKTRIIPVMIEGQSGARGPISQSPIVIQNDQRTPPVQSKSFRVLQKITDTIGNDGNTVAGVPTSAPIEGFADAEPQLQRPQYARQMSAQQARKSPNIDQMKRMQIAQDQQQLWPQGLQGNAVTKQQQQPQQLNKYPQQRTIYNEDIPQQYVHPSEQQVLEPKKYTGSAIPSRSFKILQAMTTPENAAETEGSDSNIVELNEKHNQKNNPNPYEIPNLHQNQSVSNINTTNCKNCSSTTPHPHSAPPSSSSNSSLNSVSSSSGPAQPSHYHPCSAYPPYAWCPQVLPTGGHGPYSYSVPLPPTNVETTPNWPYPYPMPPPGDNSSHQHYPPYPYYFPYFPPPMHALHAHQTSSPPSISSLEYDSQYAYDPNGYPFLPAQAYHPYPFTNITAYTRHLNPARRAISVLPDIIVTPSTDEIPHTSTQYKNPTKNEREQRDQTKIRAKSVDISEFHTLQARTKEPISREKREGSVIDMLGKRLNKIKNSAAESTLSSESKTKYVGELEKGCRQNSLRGDISSSESSSDSSDRDEVTPKVDLKSRQSLQAIKSVTNVQIYNGNTLEENEDDEDEDDVTSADGESDIFDEEGEGEVVADLELDECIEEDDEEDDYLLETEELSVIYEEESEMEKSSDQRTALKIDTCSNSSEATTINNKDLEEEIEENDDEDSDDDESLVDEEGAEDSSSVTVRLPLKFSFSRSSNDENIATVEVGNSQIEERNSMNTEEKWNGDDADSKQNYDDDRDVSVTVSLTPSSQATLADRNTEPVAIKAASQRLTGSSTVHGDGECEPQSSKEDVSVSFSLNMRNKFLNQTINGEVTNNISDLKKSSELSTKHKLTSEDEPVEEVDFFATLRATKMQAQKIKEQSANYWGRTNNKVTETEKCKDTQSTTIETKELKTTETGVNIAVTHEVIDNIWTNIDDYLTKLEAPGKKSKKISTETSDKVSERSFCKANALVKEYIIDNIWANINEDIRKLESPKKTTKNKKVESIGKSSKKNLTKSNTPVKEKITDHPLISKNADTEKVVSTKKTGTLETARNNFWSAVEETIKEPNVTEHIPKKESHKHGSQESKEKLENSEQWMSKEKKVSCSQFVKEKLHHINVKAIMLKSRMETLPQTQNAEISRCIKIKEKKELNGSCCPSVDPDERIRNTSPSKDALFPNNGENNEVDFWSTVSETPQISKSEEVEVDFWAEIEKSKSISKEYQSSCDLVKCLEEPREVDTDEEIDFWVETEANNNRNNDAVTFQKAASFWASRDRQNSVEETPYKPLTQTPFPAKLPDEPCININSWTVAALEAARGEEPEFIDPAVEEEKMLAQEFNKMPEANFEEAGTIEATNATQNNTYLEETIDADLPAEEEEEPDFWAIINSEKEKASKKVSDKEELEIKRSNYRKAMAFFTTSIDEHREKAVEHREIETTPIYRNTPVCDEPVDWDVQGAERTVINTKNNNNIENGTENLNEVNEIEESEEENDDSDEEGESESEPNIHDRNSTPTNLESKLLIIQPTIEENKHDVRTFTKLSSTDLPDQKVSVRDRIFAFESGAVETPESKQFDTKKHSLSVEGYNRKSSLSRNSSCQRSESEMEEDDSGVTDMNKQLSETDTESESFPELRKMTSYQRAATHSRLFKLLQDENDEDIAQKATQTKEELHTENELQLKPSRRKIVHNVSVTRRQNPNVLQEAETMSQRRERLSLPLRQKNSIDADNPSTPNSPASPIQGQPSSQRLVSDKLVNELVQSLLLKRDSSHLRNMPMEKLQAAAKLVLEEELDSSLLESMDSESLEKTAGSDKLAKTDSSYSDYYNSWSAAVGSSDIVPSKAFRALQDRPKRSPWSVKCPRVLSSKTINRDLTRVTESPEILVKGSKSPEHFAREGSVSKWKKF